MAHMAPSWFAFQKRLDEFMYPGLRSVIKEYFSFHRFGTRSLEEFIQEELTVQPFDGIQSTVRFNDFLRLGLAKSKQTNYDPCSPPESHITSSNCQPTVSPPIELPRSIAARHFDDEGLNPIWSHVYEQLTIDFADIIPTPAPIPGELHNFRLIHKAARSASEALFKELFFTTRRVSFLEGSIRKLEKLSVNQALSQQVTTIWLVADPKEVEAREIQLNLKSLYTIGQLALTDLVHSDPWKRSAFVMRIAKSIWQLPNVTSIALIDSELKVGGHIMHEVYHSTNGLKGHHSSEAIKVGCDLFHISSRLNRTRPKDVGIKGRRQRKAQDLYTDQDWTVQAALKLFFDVLRRLPAGRIEEFIFSAEIDFLNFKTDHKMKFEFLNSIKGLTYVGNLGRVRFPRKCNCLKRRGEKCPHSRPATFTAQLETMREQLFGSIEELTKLEVCHLERNQSAFWHCDEYWSEDEDPFRTLEELMICNSDIIYEDLVAVFKRTVELKSLVLKDVFLSSNSRNQRDWSQVFDAFTVAQEMDGHCKEIIIEGLVYNYSTKKPWRRSEMLEYFQDYEEWDITVVIKNEEGKIITMDNVKDNEYACYQELPEDNSGMGGIRNDSALG